ncbi:MAG: Gfo/Idh/MocA family oxidoreductase [Clostridia bacterium]|nr:Gfo/Idh/MocA family oxidoreductase [Clostridia bacterium]
MKKIGFIDYYLDEWHANNYPEFIKVQGNGEFEVAYAWAKIDSPLPGGMTSKEWSEKYGITVLESLDELLKKSDYIVVLSPDNPEMHEELCSLALKAKKNTYIDKTFAPDKKTAVRIFEMAQSYGTKCYSSSALFYADEYADIKTDGLSVINSSGPGTYEMYSIHQIEPIVKLMGTGKKMRIMSVGTKDYPAMILEYEDGRQARFSNFPDGAPFRMNFGYLDGKTASTEVESDFFAHCIKNMLQFFETGEIPVPHENTVEVIAIREAGLKAMETPFEWVEV